MRGKLVVIEGTDCSGKAIQTKLVIERLKKDGYKVATMPFPRYDTPTGYIVGACLLGKPKMCEKLLRETHGFFPEGGGEIDSLTACMYYAADRRYHLPTLNKYLNESDFVILDRYSSSNLAHRGGLITDKDERLKFYEKILTLEHDILELPRPDKTILLYLPYEYACILKEHREELPDEVESNHEYLKKGEQSYLELAQIYNYDIINCIKNNSIREIEDINDDVYTSIKKLTLKPR